MRYPLLKILPCLCTVLIGATSYAQADSVRFKKQVLYSVFEQYISEGVAVADVNRDGRKDILAGTFWFEAPHWKQHELDVPDVHSIGGYGNSFVNYAMDVNEDGWMDMIRIGMPSREARWYENPKGKSGHWQSHVVFHSVGNESPQFVDVDGDGRKDLLCNDPIRKKVLWISPPKKGRDTAWTPHVISNDTLLGTHLFTHGLGWGDVNGDGYNDVLIKNGWWQGAKNPAKEDWTFHSANFGADCAQMYAMDLDGDGDNDVISSSAHNYGIWWHEQVKRGDSTAWVQHEVFKEFSQSHGMALTDINGDGNPDIVTGKRFWAHNGSDPGEREPAVLYWFEYKPGKTPQWLPHLIDSDSGVGLHLVVEDVNGDAQPDIIISNKKGVFYFEQVK